MAKLLNNEIVKAVALGMVSTFAPKAVEKVAREYAQHQEFQRKARAAEEERICRLETAVGVLLDQKGQQINKRSDRPIHARPTMPRTELGVSPKAELSDTARDPVNESYLRRIERIDTQIARLQAERSYREQLIADRNQFLANAKLEREVFGKTLG